RRSAATCGSPAAYRRAAMSPRFRRAAKASTAAAESRRRTGSLRRRGVRGIVGGNFTMAGVLNPHGYNFNGYLIEDRSGNICIDPAEPDANTEAEIARRGAAVIILTNRNHVRAANRVRAATGARTAIHPADADYARGQGAELDDELSAGQRIGPLTLVAVSGKSPGEVTLHWPERKILIVGDAVIGNPPRR